MAGLSLQRRGWRASARRLDTDARGIAEVGNRSDSALGPNVAGTGTLQRGDDPPDLELLLAPEEEV